MVNNYSFLCLHFHRCKKITDSINRLKKLEASSRFLSVFTIYTLLCSRHSLSSRENFNHLLKRKDISNLPDEELLEHYKISGESSYFGVLYNRYTPLIYGLCLKYLQNADKAQDAVMQIFEDTLPKVCQYEIRVFRTWIYSVAKNHCLQILRKDQKEITVDFSIFVMESDDILHLLDEKSNDEQRMQVLSRCIEKLSEPQRLCIVNFFLEEKSYADVSEKTGYSVKHVKSNIQNGKRNLKICMEKQERE